MDRKGLRWALRLCSPYPIIVITHRGRRSGRLYRTPLELLAGGPDGQMLVLPLAGHRADWYRNVLAGGLVGASCRGREGTLRWRRVPVPEARTALDAYRRKHRIYTRILLEIVARLNDASGTSSHELAAELPVLALSFDSFGKSSERP